MSPLLKLEIAAAALVAAAFAASADAATATPPGGAITFTVCGQGTVIEFKQPKGTDVLEFRCPGNPVPPLRLPGCVGPHVKSDGRGNYTITCDKLVPKP